MKNQVYTGPPTSRRFADCPTTVKAGDPVLLGSEPAVALDDYQAGTGGTTFLLGGSFALTVVGESGSPLVSHRILPGDKVYYDGGVLDVATNVTTGGTIDANSFGVLFGHIDPSYTSGVGSGLTDTAAAVKLAGSE